MLNSDQIREIARHQRLRGVEVVGVKGDHGSVSIRIAAAVTAAASGNPGAAVPLVVATKAITVRSDRLGTVILSGRPDLAKPLQGGDAVDKGQVLALVELGEEAGAVVAPANGILGAVLVRDGQRADYGMPMFELTLREG